jgi:hypothetical protein
MSAYGELESLYGHQEVDLSLGGAHRLIGALQVG